MIQEQFKPQQLMNLCLVNRQGMERAALTLSQMLRKKISIEVAESWMSRRTLAALSQSEQTLGIVVNVSGTLSGGLLLALSAEAASWLCQHLLGNAQENDFLAEPASSMLKEVANIMASAFLAALDNRLGVRLMPEPPMLYAKPLAEIVSAFQGQQDEPCLIAQTLIIAEETEAEPFQGAIYLLPDQKTLEQLALHVGNN